MLFGQTMDKKEYSSSFPRTIFFSKRPKPQREPNGFPVGSTNRQHRSTSPVSPEKTSVAIRFPPGKRKIYIHSENHVMSGKFHYIDFLPAKKKKARPTYSLSAGILKMILIFFPQVVYVIVP